ncbi:hypothetical protein PIB30_039816 [Stylosanthes scabra]|uniref:Uncharacterized protein n=1 Tax=Stylosanthes scabra TaxID=79078 RepID=A0ABU6QEY1_9FABA|nr:hypothetical protein [Stylosanthes scabra]
MPHVKKPVYKRTRGESSSSMELPPEGHPMAHWFQSKKDFDHYSTDLAPRKIISPSGDKIQLGGSNEKFNRNYSREDAFILFNIPLDIPRPIIGCLSVEHCLLHYLIVYILVPRANNHGLIMEGDIELMWRMQSHYKINWIAIITSHMRNMKNGKPSKGLPYAMLWTKIFKYLKINLSQVKKKKLEYNNCIDTHVLNHMKREQNQPQVEEQQGGEEEGDQAMEDVQVEPPQEQPSMLDLMREL